MHIPQQIYKIKPYKYTGYRCSATSEQSAFYHNLSLFTGLVHQGSRECSWEVTWVQLYHCMAACDWSNRQEVIVTWHQWSHDQKQGLSHISQGQQSTNWWWNPSHDFPRSHDLRTSFWMSLPVTSLTLNNPTSSHFKITAQISPVLPPEGSAVREWLKSSWTWTRNIWFWLRWVFRLRPGSRGWPSWTSQEVKLTRSSDCSGTGCRSENKYFLFKTYNWNIIMNSLQSYKNIPCLIKVTISE